MIPVAVWWFSQSYQLQKDQQERATRQQDAIKTYLNQLTTTFLDGDIKKDKNLQKVTRASTLALLQDPNMTGAGKGQVITFLSEIGLITKEMKIGQKLTKIPAPPVLSLSNANLSGAKLSFANLSGANLNRANLNRADLSFADLSFADLSGAKLSGANLGSAYLYNAELSRAELSDANLYNANLIFAKLSGADLSGADLSDANLSSANLSDAYFIPTDLSDADLSGARLLATDLRKAQGLTQQQLEGENPPLLCNVALPKSITVNKDRDCDRLPQELLKRFPKTFKTLDEAKQSVNELRKKKWE